MAEPFIGQIIMGGWNFAPRGYALCNGQLMPIAQNTALFSLLGTTFGGNGQTTFALPDLQGRVPLHWGQGPGLSPRTIGESAGSESVTLITSQMPAHGHPVTPTGTRSDPNTSQPSNAVWAATGAYNNAPPSTVPMQTIQSGVAGGGQPHDNMPPYLCITICIALEGIFPSRS